MSAIVVTLISSVSGFISLNTDSALGTSLNSSVPKNSIITVSEQKTTVRLLQSTSEISLDVGDPQRQQVLTVQLPGIQGPVGASGANGIQGIQGPKGDAGSSFIFTQVSPITQWIINHNLGFYPSVSVFTMGMQEVDAEIIQYSINQTRVYFFAPFAGFARLN